MGLVQWDCQWQRYRDTTHHGAFRGYSAALCGTGPSIRQVDRMPLEANNNLLKVCLNNTFKFITPDLWIGMDAPTSFDPELWSTPGMKYYNKAHSEKLVRGTAVRDLPETYFYEPFLVENVEDISLETSPYMRFMFEGNTFSVALGVLNWLQVDTVYLIGCDLGGSNKISRMGSKKKYDSKRQKQHLTNALNLLRYLNKHGRMNLISCTPDSPMNEFLEYIPTEEL